MSGVPLATRIKLICMKDNALIYYLLVHTRAHKIKNVASTKRYNHTVIYQKKAQS